MSHAERECRSCQRRLPLSEFWKQANRRDGLQSECKECMKVRTTDYHRANRDRLRAPNNARITARRQRQPIKALLAGIRARAAKRGLECTITEADLHFPSRCPVLGIPLSFGLGMGLGASLSVKDTRYSVDRIDNSKGYVPGNVIVVSYRANRLKSDASPQEIAAIARFYERLGANESGQASLSDVQPPAEEKAGTLSLCVEVG